MILRFDGSGDVTNRYLHGRAVDQILADEQVASTTTPGDVFWALTDHLGTVRDVAEYDAVTGITSIANHMVYDSFGNRTSETNATIDSLFGYTGREWDDDVDLQYNRARWYDPNTGTWISNDPVGFAVGDANLYRYVGNGPTSRADSSGLDWLDDWFINPVNGWFDANIQSPVDNGVDSVNSWVDVNVVPIADAAIEGADDGAMVLADTITWGLDSTASQRADEAWKQTQGRGDWIAQLGFYGSTVGGYATQSLVIPPANGMCPIRNAPTGLADDLFPIASSLGAKADKLRNQLANLGNQAATQTGKKAATALEKMARKAGLTVAPGGKHLRVLDEAGDLITTIPHSPHAKGTIKSIAESIMDAAGF